MIQIILRTSCSWLVMMTLCVILAACERLDTSRPVRSAANDTINRAPRSSWEVTFFNDLQALEHYSERRDGHIAAKDIERGIYAVICYHGSGIGFGDVSVFRNTGKGIVRIIATPRLHLPKVEIRGREVVITRKKLGKDDPGGEWCRILIPKKQAQPLYPDYS